MELEFAIDENGNAVCRPFKTLEEIRGWIFPKTKEEDAERLANVKDRNSQGSKAVQSKAVTSSKSNTSQLLVCHDMCGGYLEDRFLHGCTDGTSYRFYHWQYIDIFIYFSHNFVTIPPPGWIKAAHRHGVRVLGTVITEWEDGAATCKEMLKSQETVDEVTTKLAEIALLYGFNGWLINIENQIEAEQIPHLQSFVQQLTMKCHTLLDSSKVLWYDSVVNSGELKWQDELNSLNEMFFHVSDGIFLNYLITPEKLARSCDLASASGRQYDVFAGVDVFGRGSPHGGGFNSKETIKMIMDHGLSCALFAPGWVYEVLGKQDFEANEEAFWGIISDLRIPHSIDVPFATSFCQGYGEKFFLSGEVLSQTPWYNIGLQQIQPNFTHSQFLSYSVRKIITSAEPDKEDAEKEKKEEKFQIEVDSHPSHPAEPKLSFDLSDGFQGGGCLTLMAKRLDSAPVLFKLYKLKIGKHRALRVSVTWKSPSDSLSTPCLVLVGSEAHIDLKTKIICTEHDLSDTEKKSLTKMFTESVGSSTSVCDMSVAQYITAEHTHTSAFQSSSWRTSLFTADLTNISGDGHELTQNLILSVVLIPSEQTVIEPVLNNQLCLKLGHLQVLGDSNLASISVKALVSNVKCLEVKIVTPLRAKHCQEILMNSFLEVEGNQGSIGRTSLLDQTIPEPTLQDDCSDVPLKQRALSTGDKNTQDSEGIISKHSLDVTALETPSRSDFLFTLYILKWKAPSTPVDFYVVSCTKKSSGVRNLIGQALGTCFVWKQQTGEEKVSSFSVQPVSALTGRPLDVFLFTM